MLENEILLAFFQIIFYTIIFSSPVLLIKEKLNNLSLLDKFSINILFILNIFLIFSFFKNGQLIILIILTLLFFFSIIKNYLSFIKHKKISYYLLCFFIFCFLISLDVVYELYFDWDTKIFWFYKVLNFYQGQSFSNLVNLPVNDYPHLGTFIWSFFWKYPFDKFEYTGRLFYVFVYSLSIFSVSECLKAKTSIRIIFASIIIFLTYNYYLFSGEQDILVFSILLIFSKYVYYLFNDKKLKNNLLLIILLLLSSNILFWTKNETIIFVLILFFTIIITSKLSNKNNLLLFCGLIFFIFIRIIIFKSYGISANEDWYQLDKTLSINFETFIYKIKNISFYFFAYILSIPIYIFNLASMILILNDIKNNKFVKFLVFSFLLNVSFLIIAYLFKHDNVLYQIKASMKLFMVEFSGIYILSLIYFLNRFSIKNKLKFSIS